MRFNLRRLANRTPSPPPIFLYELAPSRLQCLPRSALHPEQNASFCSHGGLNPALKRAGKATSERVIDTRGPEPGQVAVSDAAIRAE